MLLDYGFLALTVEAQTKAISSYLKWQRFYILKNENLTHARVISQSLSKALAFINPCWS